jgi:outer membrane receptor protein involved in Fe transport
MKNPIIAFLCSFWPLLSMGQTATGKLSGVVTDKNTQETLIGVHVKVEESSQGTVTQLDGSYQLTLAPGTYSVQFSYLGYATWTKTQIIIRADEVTLLPVALESATGTLEEVVVAGALHKESDGKFVEIRRQAIGMLDGLSRDFIRLTPDRHTGDLLKRVSGLHVQEQGFAVVRGLPERYNLGLFHEIPMIPTEPDRKAFQFQIIPAFAVGNIWVHKTALPSMPGDFAGGIIQVQTRDLPDSNLLQVTTGTSAHFLTTFQPFTSTGIDHLPALGLDHSAGLPEGFPDNAAFNDLQTPVIQKDELVALAQSLPNRFGPQSFMAPLPIQLQLLWGYRKNLPSGKKSQTSRTIGSTLGISFTNQYQYVDIQRNDFNNIEQTKDFRDQQFQYSANPVMLWNLQFVEKGKKIAHRISIRQLASSQSQLQSILREGNEPDLGLALRAYNHQQSQNRLYTGHVEGVHSGEKYPFSLKWVLGYTAQQRDLPDYRILEYKRPLEDTLQPFTVPVSNSVQPTLAGRFFSEQKDRALLGLLEGSFPFSIKKTSHTLVVGTSHQWRTRAFEARQFGYVRYANSSFQTSLASWGPDSIFRSENMGPQGFMIREVTRNSDAYDFQSMNHAGYLQIESNFFQKKLQLVYGVRMEAYRQQLQTFEAANDQVPVNIDTTFIDWLPSLFLKYSPHTKWVFKAAYSKTVNRPEARELAPFTFYDFSMFALASGNSQLKPASIHNVDLRADFYPWVGQMVSATIFYKHFTNPIEKQMVPVLNRKFDYINIPEAQSVGFELETRLFLGSFLQVPFLKDLTLMGNMARIYSTVSTGTLSFVGKDRPLQGQAPWMGNLTLQYIPAWWKGSMSCSFHYMGSSIFSVGDITYPDIVENERWTMDIQVSRRFFKNRMEGRLSLRDVFAMPWEFYQDLNQDGSFQRETDNLMMSYRMASTLRFQWTFNF